MSSFIEYSARFWLVKIGLNWCWQAIRLRPRPWLPTHHPFTTNSISVISQLLMTQFWQNFKGRLLEQQKQKKQKYQCYSWPNFDQTLKLDFWDPLYMGDTSNNLHWKVNYRGSSTKLTEKVTFNYFFLEIIV